MATTCPCCSSELISSAGLPELVKLLLGPGELFCRGCDWMLDRDVLDLPKNGHTKNGHTSNAHTSNAHTSNAHTSDSQVGDVCPHHRNASPSARSGRPRRGARL